MWNVFLRLFHLLLIFDFFFWRGSEYILIAICYSFCIPTSVSYDLLPCAFSLYDVSCWFISCEWIFFCVIIVRYKFNLCLPCLVFFFFLLILFCSFFFFFSYYFLFSKWREIVLSLLLLFFSIFWFILLLFIWSFHFSYYFPSVFPSFSLHIVSYGGIEQ